MLADTGLPPELLPSGNLLSIEQARQLRNLLARPVSSETCATSAAVDFILCGVLEGGRAVQREELDRRLLGIHTMEILVEGAFQRPPKCMVAIVTEEGAVRTGPYVFPKEGPSLPTGKGTWRPEEVPGPYPCPQSLPVDAR
jgi:hypothetical protein